MRDLRHTLSVREKAAGIKWERELSEPEEVGAGTPEGERTQVETYAFPPEYVPGAGPTLATAPVQPRLSDRVAQLARDLCLDHDHSAPAGDFPPQAPSSANAARASPDGKVKSRTKTWSPTTAKLTTEFVRSRLREVKGKVLKKPRGDENWCRLVAE